VGLRPAALFVCRKDRTIEKIGLFRSIVFLGDTENPSKELAGDTLMKKTNFESVFTLTSPVRFAYNPAV
jgi:hypothetical protein